MEHVSENEWAREEREQVDGAQRGRPGRPSVAERQAAVLALMSGKASVDQLALKYGVRPETIEGWREQALAGVEAAFRQGGRTERERELERENTLLKSALTRATMKAELMENALEQFGGPRVPTRSRK
jgi:transposase-like protein